jgi:prolyl-tRNA editing enzyme YbaK/EbsC (Cys-tRNA(Pro) deacylase)
MKDKVIAAARDLGLEVEVQRLDGSTGTVEEAARVLGAHPGQIAKSLVFVADGEPILCIASGAHRVDVERLCDALDCAEVRQAAPAEVRAATGFAIGGVAPCGHELPVVFDSMLLEQDRIWASGGDANSMFEVDPRALADCVHARIAAVGDEIAPVGGE